MTSHKKIYETIIIGAGASGLLCSSLLKHKHLVLELSSAAGQKLSISGGGRCNFTNFDMNESHFSGNIALIKAALKSFSTQDVISLVKSLGLDYEVKKRSGLFLKSSAKELVLKLKDRAGLIKYDEQVISVTKEENLFVLHLKEHSYLCKNLVIATGGLSYPSLGVSSLAYDVASYFNHKVTQTRPALVGLTTMPSEAWFKELSGVSLEAKITVMDKVFIGDLLFTHKGLSGPLILNTSLYHEKGFLEIDFMPKFDIAKLRGSKKISYTLPVPKSFIKVFLDAHEIEDKHCNTLSLQDLEIIGRLKSYKFAPAGTFGYTKAEITKGGIDGFDIKPNSFESKLCNNLYFLGECLDVNGELGGYNIHFAFASASLCAKALNANLMHFYQKGLKDSI